MPTYTDKNSWVNSELWYLWESLADHYTEFGDMYTNNTASDDEDVPATYTDAIEVDYEIVPDRPQLTAGE